MTHYFQIRGNRVRYCWRKDCPRDAAIAHATQIACVCAQDRVYDGAVIRITDEGHREVAIVPIRDVCAALGDAWAGSPSRRAANSMIVNAGPIDGDYPARIEFNSDFSK